MRLAVFAILILLPVSVSAEIIGKPRIIDGDTIDIGGKRIHLHGIDAPESDQTCRRDREIWRCGRQAALALANWIGQRPVRCEEQDRDCDGSIVAKCFVGGQDLASGWRARVGRSPLSISATRSRAPRDAPNRIAAASGPARSTIRGSGASARSETRQRRGGQPAGRARRRSRPHRGRFRPLPRPWCKIYWRCILVEATRREER